MNMYPYLDAMKEILESDPDAKRQFLSIYEPVTVCTPLADARRELRVMADGELRCYGSLDKKGVDDKGVAAYLSSRDCGMSWKLKYKSPDDLMGAAVQSPYTGRWITVRGNMVYLDDGDGARYHTITERPLNCMFQPIFLTHRNRCLVAGQISELGNPPTVLYSDDNGETWTTVILPIPPRYEVTWPDRDVRWLDCGSEPSIVELPDGRLMMLLRNAWDRFYVSYSSDDGETWTECEPSVFYSTITTPHVYRLSDGRVLCTWCNTTPFPEFNHNLQPETREYCRSGKGEDAFTNRDAAHAAITSDGKTWEGFREVLLNPIRNEPDFRIAGGKASSRDKSIHQSQILELPYNKIMVYFGQHTVSRRVVIFDLDWLLADEREENFDAGLSRLSTQTYVKSLADTYVRFGFPGHCAWNRTDGPLLMPDPTEYGKESLQLCRIDDPRLISPAQGAVWNFPSARKGSVEIDLQVLGEGIRITLADRWLNPVDPSVRDRCPLSFVADKQVTEDDKRHTLRIEWDLDDTVAHVFLDGVKKFRVPFRYTAGDLAPVGLSYLHLQSDASAPDPQGTYVAALRMKKA